jgi:predicted metal-dependent phosphoesterase TrpH
MPLDSSFSAADLHIHSRHSDGLNTVREILQHLVTFTTVRVVSVTDHDTLAGSWEAMELTRAMGLPIEVIPGVEITTSEGHLLAYDLLEPVPAHRSLEWTISAVQEQGGIAVIAHPMAPLVASASREALLRLRRAGRAPDGLETHNGSVAGRMSRARAVDFNRKHLNWTTLGSSDAHILAQLASCVTLFPGSSVTDLRNAIKSGAVRPDASKTAIRTDRALRGPRALGSTVVALGHRMVLRLGARMAL